MPETLPLVTTAAIGCCILLHVLQWAFFELSVVTLSPALVVRGQIYRIVTSALFHANLLHLGMNMLSAAALGRVLERRLGTGFLVLSSAASLILTGLVHVVVASVASVFEPRLYYQASIGFSGVLFHWSVLECHTTSRQSMRLFVVDVPTTVYPWALLILLQFVLPNLSFLGHLSGILVGTLQFAMHWPSLDLIQRVDCLESLPSFCEAPSSISWRTDSNPLMGYLRSAVERIRVFMCGRGSQSNLRLGRMPTWPSDDSDIAVPLATAVNEAPDTEFV